MSLVSFKHSTLFVFVCLLTSCKMTPVDYQEKEIRNTLDVIIDEAAAKAKEFKVPKNISQRLMPAMLKTNDPVFDKRFDIAAKDIDVRSFFSSLVAQTPYSVAFHNDVTGTLTLQLKQVTLNETLEMVQELYGYRVEKRGPIFQIYPAGIITETFSFNYLLVKRNGTSQTSITSGGLTDRQSGGQNGSQNSGSQSNNGNSSSSSSSSSSGGRSGNGTFIESTTETDYWKELEQNLSAMISGEGRRVILSPQASLVTVIGDAKDIATIKNFLAKSEENLHRQVILEARIIEVTLHDGYQQGIEWKKLLSNVGSGDVTDFNFSTSSSSISDVVSAAIGGVTSLSFTNANFSGVLSLLSTQGDVNVLSSPRITAINNQKSVIKVGSDEYFVTDVSSNSGSVGNNVTVTPEVELTPFFSGIALDVTPQIDDQGSVLLHVHPSVIDVKEQQKTIQLQNGSFQLPLANSSIREADTIIKAQSGDVVIIGGLMSTRTRDEVSKVPLLGSIPWIGELFTNRKEVVDKTELIILIKPTVVGQGTWQRQLQKSQKLLNKWYKK
ncbi:MAG: pilus (MSHA type) biogenesis protein MshL [Psychrobium sp.]|nr:pilus (MSHA type) biogenesis protein MshL [Psychrobium sp.]